MTQIRREDLDQALPNIMAAPKNGAAIGMLCLRPDFGERHFVDQVTVTADQGIPGERWLKYPWMRLPDGSPDPSIQVSILPKRVLDLVWHDRENTPHPGDTFVVDMDLSLANLPTGTRLKAGSAILQVSPAFNDACVKWKVRYGVEAKDWVTAPGHPELRLRGILCCVVQDGVIRNGDKLEKVSS